MIQIKRFMTLMIVATIFWLMHVLSQIVGVKASLVEMSCIVALLLAFRIKFNFLKYFALTTILITLFATSFSSDKSPNIAQNNAWWEFDEDEITRQVELGNVVFVDITADWCITCKFNKARVLEDKNVMSVLKGGNIVIMRGDITKPNEEIMQFMRQHDRFAIPFDIVFGPNAKSGLLTSEILTKKEIFDLIAKAGNFKASDEESPIEQ